VICRIRYEQRTCDDLDRHLANGRPKPEIIRNLKRYVAREIHRHLPRH
jgi:transposase